MLASPPIAIKHKDKKRKVKVNIIKQVKINACWYESNTRVCGNIKHVDYNEIVESKMNDEPYYGDIDLFGF